MDGYARLAEQADKLPDTRLVYVAHREGDFIDLMARAHDLGTPVDWLIRAAQNRKVPGEQDKLWDGFKPDHVLGDITFTLPGRKKQAAREVRQQISVRRCMMRCGKGTSIEVTALEAREMGAPKSVTPVTWRLLTNRMADTAGSGS